MTADLVTLTESNPLLALRRADGTWSAREVQKSGHVHAEWRAWEEAIKRGDVLLRQFGIDAGQGNFGSTTKVIERVRADGRSTGVIEIGDYDLDPLHLFAACQQSRLPGDDQPWFVASDVCKALGYTNRSAALAQHVQDDDRQRLPRSEGIAFHDTLFSDRRVNEVALINESGVYALIFGSKLPFARQFKHWVTSEVLPSIRETGVYNGLQGKSFSGLPAET